MLNAEVGRDRRRLSHSVAPSKEGRGESIFMGSENINTVDVESLPRHLTIT